MKKAITILMLAVAILIGGASADAKTKTRKKAKVTATQSSKGYRVENGKIIPTGSKPVIVDFYTDWCGPCKRYAPNFEYVKSRYGSRAIFIRINIDNNREISNYYNVHSIPTTMIIVEYGNRYYMRKGYMETYELENFINSCI